ncbi:MAG: hypothetical protein HQL36_11055 [Alphaproteobacteria bacterium]|nr:hypothetical protein [Alphaproteobacteria bacterium]MBF0251689.1 hypothetical protein [Alphaproteobacteria bacterium]
MSVNSAGSAVNVQQAHVALRQTIQAEQVAAVAVTEAANQAAQRAQQSTVATDVQKSEGTKPVPVEGRGEVVDVEA